MATITLQPDATAGQDVYIRSAAYAGANFGVAGLLIGHVNADSVVRVLIKFDLTSLPSTATLSSVILSLYATADLSGNARTFRVYRQKRVWIEGTQNNVVNITGASWNHYSVGNAWQTVGGFGADDCEQTDIGSRAFTATETLNVFKDFVLTPTTKDNLDLGNGWLIKADTETNDAYAFASSDDATAANRPKLVIVYKVLSPVVGTSAGTGSANATLRGKARVDGSVSVVSSVDGTLVGTGNLAGNSTGVASATATAVLTGYLRGDSAGATSETALLAAVGYLQGSAEGEATAVARPAGDSSLVGSSLAIATESAILTASGYADGISLGTATVIGAIVALGRLAGFSAGIAGVVGDLDDGIAPTGDEVTEYRKMFLGIFRAMR